MLIVRYCKPEVKLLTLEEEIQLSLLRMYAIRTLRAGKINEDLLRDLSDCHTMKDIRILYSSYSDKISSFIEKHIWNQKVPHAIFLEMIDMEFLVFASERVLMHLRTYRHLSPAYYQSTQKPKKGETIYLSIYSRKGIDVGPTSISFLDEIDDRFVFKGTMSYGYLKANMREWNHILKQRLLDKGTHAETREVCLELKNLILELDLDFLLDPEIRGI